METRLKEHPCDDDGPEIAGALGLERVRLARTSGGLFQTESRVRLDEAVGGGMDRFGEHRARDGCGDVLGRSDRGR
jgi:hypothetical protein